MATDLEPGPLRFAEPGRSTGFPGLYKFTIAATVCIDIQGTTNRIAGGPRKDSSLTFRGVLSAAVTAAQAGTLVRVPGSNQGQQAFLLVEQGRDYRTDYKYCLCSNEQE